MGLLIQVRMVKIEDCQINLKNILFWQQFYFDYVNNREGEPHREPARIDYLGKSWG